MARTSHQLPKRFPVGTKYVVESRGSVVRRYVEFPDGRKITLPTRQAVACTQAASRHRSKQQTARPPLAPKLRERIQEALKAPGRPGARKIAAQSGVNPSRVQQISAGL
jgi:hypothetical protein